MKLKLTLASFLVCGSLAMVFAAGKVETCQDKYKQCSEVCENQKANGKMGGRTDESVEAGYKSCMKSCDKAKTDCEKTEKKK